MPLLRKSLLSISMIVMAGHDKKIAPHPEERALARVGRRA
jgi:hypothetical protein